MTQLVRRSAPIAAILFSVTAGADAHSGFAGAGDFWNGAFHPFLDIKQAVALLAFGLALGRTQGSPDRAGAGSRTRFGAFGFLLAGLAAGGLAAAILIAPETASLAPLPLFAAGALLLAPSAFIGARARTIFCAAGLAAGLAFGAETPPVEDRIVFLGGLFLASLVLLVYASALWEKFERPWFAIAARIAGSWLVAIGAMLLGAMFRR